MILKMINLNVTKFGTHELSCEEIQSGNGGIAPILLAIYATDILMTVFAVGIANGCDHAAK